MTMESLRVLPVASLAAKDCALFLWVVDSHLDVAIDLAKSWGFKYKTRAFEWLKSTKSGNGYRISMGYWSRKQSESCLLFTRGSPKRLSKGVKQIIEEPIREHSRKPDEAYRRIEALVAGPYCELFAKRRWPGWDGWGDEYPPLDNREAEMLALTVAIRELL
jgi:N6-adenosine-specific RNA methylase IME4